MSGLESSFLEAIARQPHDWLPRLIFADWLEEQGDPRGELIRLSHQLTRLDCEDRQRKETRLQELRRAGVIWPSPSLANSLEMKFVLIPPGQFRMGSPQSEFMRGPDEEQVNVILTQGFWLGQYEVTQAEWLQIMGTSIEQQAEKGTTDRKLMETGGTHPMYFVSWEQATEFCRLLTQQEHAASRLPADWQYTLPTEAQWEYACRTGTTTATAFGDQLDSTLANFHGWYSYPHNKAPKGEFGRLQLMVVGSYRANAWNLYDMHGNVQEWCRDWYVQTVHGGIDREIQEQAGQPWRVIRGGDWTSHGKDCRSASRHGSPAGYSFSTMGFRVALVPAR